MCVCVLEGVTHSTEEFGFRVSGCVSHVQVCVGLRQPGRCEANMLRPTILGAPQAAYYPHCPPGHGGHLEAAAEEEVGEAGMMPVPGPGAQAGCGQR